MSMWFGGLSIPMNNALCEASTITSNSFEASALDAFSLIELSGGIVIVTILSSALVWQNL
jgi:hypothetical protein